MNPLPICIYHGKCPDGFTAAWVVNRYIAGIDFHPGIYGEAPPDVTGRDVILVDFSYKRPVLLAMAEQANSILILDHHKTAAEDLAGFEAFENFRGWEDWVNNGGHGIRAVFDMERSGAGLAWDFFFPLMHRPNLVDYAEDRDLWRFSLPSSREVNAYILAWEYTFQNWDSLNRETVGPGAIAAVAHLGAAIERKQHKDVAELVSVCRRRMLIGGIEVWGASLPYTLTSDAGHLMAQGEPFAACYWDTPAGRVFSLRSAEEGADVSAIAKSYGGGGHKHAAGFQIPYWRLTEFELGDGDLSDAQEEHIALLKSVIRKSLQPENANKFPKEYLTEPELGALTNAINC